MTEAVLEREKIEALPESWCTPKLGDICLEIERANPVSLFKDSFRYVDITSIDNVYHKIVDPKELPPAQASSRARQVIKAGDVLFSTTRTYLENIALVPDELDAQIASTAFCVLRAASLIEPSYIYWFVTNKSFINTLTQLQRGNSPPAVSDDDVKNQEIPLAPLNEQKRIVSKIEELFSQLEDGEAALKRAQKLVEQYRQSVLKAAVTGELTKDWREENKHQIESGEALLQHILKARRDAWEQAEFAKLQAKGKTPKDDTWKKKYPEPKVLDTTSLPNLPEGWSWVALETLADITGGVTVDAKRKVENGVIVPYLRVANVQRGYLDLETVKEIEVSQEVFQALKLQHGDILFNEGGDIDKLGRGWVWSDEIENCIHQNHVFRARCYVKDIPGKFISWYANVMAKQYFMSEGKQTTNLASISLTKLKALPIPVPPLSELNEIVSRVEDTLSLNGYYSQLLQDTSKHSAKVRQSILKAAFSGQLVPQDPSDEPVSELLKRIAEEREVASQNGTKPKARKAKK